MPRLAAVLLAVLVPGFAAAQVPGSFRIVDVKVEKDKAQWTDYQVTPVQETVTAEVERNGMKVIETRTVTVTKVVPVTTTVELKALKVTDAAGKVIAADKLAELLKEAPAVVTTGPIPEKHRALFKDKTIFVELPGPMPPK